MIKFGVPRIYILLTGLGLLWAGILTYKYVHFGFYDWDLAFFNQSMWNLLRGRQYSSLFGYNFFGDHASFLALALLPVYALSQTALTLLYIKVTAFILAMYWLYKIAKEDLGESVALVVVLIFAVFPANMFSMLYEFNMECFAPLFIFMMFWAHRKENLRFFWIAAVLLFLTKENLTLIIVTFGLYSLFLRRKPLWSILPILVGVFMLLGSMYAVKCIRGEAGVSAVLRYQHLFVSPAGFLRSLFSVDNLVFAKDLFGPFLVPLMFFPAALFIGAPIFFQHALSIHATEHSILFFYGFAMTPFIFMAFIHFLCWVRKRFNAITFKIILIFIVLSIFMSIAKWQGDLYAAMPHFSNKGIEIRNQFLAKIPSDAKVVASFDFLARLSSRQYLYPFYKVYSNDFQQPQLVKSNLFAMGKIFVLPGDVEYAIIDFNERWYVNAPKEKIQYVTAFLKGGWVLLDQRGSLTLFVRSFKK